MVYKFASSRNIISLLYDEGIKTSDWEGRVAGWCLKALKALSTLKVRWAITVEVEVKDYKVTIPDTLDIITSIEFDDVKLNELWKHRPLEKDNPIYARSYQINNGEIIFTFTDETIKIHGSYYPIQFEPDLNSYFPLYPDINAIEDYLVKYCIKNIMLRGYKHSMYSFKELNYVTNINMLLAEAKKDAIKSINRMNSEERRRIANISIRPDVDHNVDVTKLFN